MRAGSTVALFVGLVVALSVSGSAGENRPVATPFGTTIGTGEPSHPADVPLRALQVEPILMASDHIVAQQCFNGGFGWPHNDCSATYHGITGPILSGVLAGYNHSRDGFHLVGALNGGAFDMTSVYDNGEVRFASFTPAFMYQLARDADNTTFSDFVSTELFDELAAGTYGPDDHDTARWILEIQTARTGTWVNLRPWEFQTLVPTAKVLGQPGQDALFEQAILDGLATLDNSDPVNVYSDILGVAGAVRGLAYARRFTFPAIVAPLHSGVNGIDNLEALAAYLASLRNPDGSWYWHSNLPGAGTSDEDVQTTAYAVLALMEVDIMTAATYQAANGLSRDWLVSLQGADGGIPSYPGGDENTEVEGEALSAIAAVEALFFLDGFEAGNTDLWSSVMP